MTPEPDATADVTDDGRGKGNTATASGRATNPGAEGKGKSTTAKGSRLRPSGTGVARVLVTGALLGGLVAAASTSSAVIDLATGDSDADATTGQAATALVENASLTCVGPELGGVKGAPDIGQQVTVVAEAAPGTLTSASGAGTLRLTAGQAAPVATDAKRELSAVVGETTSVTVAATGSMAAGLSAVQQFGSDTKDLRGLSLTACTAPAAESWLIAGGGAPGRQERVVLANPGANEVTVDLSVLGEKGPVASDNGRGIVVPGRGRTNVLVDAIAGGEASPTVHVTARGGAVVAALSDVWLDGSVAAGLDTTVPTEAPDTRLVIPVVDLTQAGTLRLAVPGEAQAVVSVRLLSTSGASPLPGGGVHRVPGGSSIDLPLADIPAGSYALEVTSDVPVLAAAMAQAREGSAPGDFAWTPATHPLTELAGMPLPAAGGTTAHQLALVASGEDAKVTVVTRKGEDVAERSVDLVADRLTTVDLADAQSVWLTDLPERGVNAAVQTTTGTGPGRMLTVTPLTDLVVSTTASRAHPLP